MTSRPDADRTTALHAIRAVVDNLGRSARKIETRTGFTNAQLFLLRQLIDTESLSVGALAQRARTRPNTVSTTVSRLVAGGYLSKTAATDDARRANVSLTPRARRLLAKAPVAPTERLMGALNSLSAAEARALATGLRALGRELGLSLHDPPILFDS